MPTSWVLAVPATGDLQLATAEDRIIFVAETVEKLSPQMDQISGKLQEINTEFQAINENRYPVSVGGKPVRERIVTLKNTVAGTAESIGQFQPIIKLLPDLLGNPEPKKYLIMFQNDAELRPTGGFLTAYATMSILKGKITECGYLHARCWIQEKDPRARPHQKIPPPSLQLELA